MKCILLALALVCGIQAVIIPKPMKHLDIKKVQGDWKTMMLLANNVDLLEPKISPLLVFINHLKVDSQDNLEITANKWEMNNCVEKKWTMTATNPAEFRMDYPQKNQKNQMIVVDTDYQDFLLLCVKNVDSQQVLACQCLTKTLNSNNDQALEKCNKITRNLPIYNKIVLSASQLNGGLEKLLLTGRSGEVRFHLWTSRGRAGPARSHRYHVTHPQLLYGLSWLLLPRRLERP
ncbi:glycodelin [Suncus etruscus]|uniref:glycodelin n=1 Tax=Suncus etruscus TaxID=109475 RepID=UPI00210FBDD6|nr:glycodelin [Suncus etruscus]